MDSLDTIGARLRELIDAKIERRQGLVDEIAAIDQELTDAKRLLEQWDAPAAPAPRHKTPRQATRMPLTAVIALLQDGVPRTARDILTHFGISDGRAAVVFKSWEKHRHVSIDQDGRVTLPNNIRRIS